MSFSPAERIAVFLPNPVGDVVMATPVLGPLRQRFGADLEVALVPTGPDHARVDLGALALRALESAGLPPHAIGTAAVDCTRCDAERFHSYRRDGARAGRLLHFVRAGNRPEAALDSPQGPA
jgi:copper oxidase (laccase) domain-containing protein